MFAELVRLTFSSKLTIKDVHGTVHLEARDLPRGMEGTDAALLLAGAGWTTGDWKYEFGGRWTCYSVTKDK